MNAMTAPEAGPDALCGWAHTELARLTTAARLTGEWGRRWKSAAAAARGRGEIGRAELIEDMLGEMAEIMSRPGRRQGPHAEHLTAARWHLDQYIACTRPAPRHAAPR